MKRKYRTKYFKIPMSRKYERIFTRIFNRHGEPGHSAIIIQPRLAKDIHAHFFLGAILEFAHVSRLNSVLGAIKTEAKADNGGKIPRCKP